MKHLTDILNESILDDEDTLTKPMDDFIDRPFQSIFNYGTNIKSQRDWEKYLELFIKSIEHKCVEIYDSKRGLSPHELFHKYKKHWVVSIKDEGKDFRKVIHLNKYVKDFIAEQAAIISYRNFPNKIRLMMKDSMKYLHIWEQKAIYYVLDEKQSKVVEDMLNSFENGNFPKWKTQK